MEEGRLETYLRSLTDMLRQHAEPHRAEAAQRDKSTQLECLAIRVPVLRDIALKQFALKELEPEARLQVHDHIWKQSQLYEVLSVPLLYYRARKGKIEPFEFQTIKGWIDRIDNWGHADDLAVTLSFCNENFADDVMPFLRELNGSGELWRIRVSIVAMTHYSGKNAVYLEPELAFSMIEPHLAHKNKYISNAVGWVLREYAKRYPDVTAKFIKTHRAHIAPTALRRMTS